MKYININVDGKEYTLVDEFDDCDKNKIYYFVGDENNIFCFKVNEEYIPITNKKLIKKVKIKHDLIRPEILYKKKSTKDTIKEKIGRKKEIDDNTKKIFIEEIVGVLKEHYPDFNDTKARKRLNEVKIYVTKKLPNRNGIMAYYDYNKDEMYFSEDDILAEDIESKRTRLHESIHALYYVECKSVLQEIKMKTYANREVREKNWGLREGATEELVESIYAADNKELTYCYEEFDIECALSNDCSYTSIVSLIKQIKFITGEDTRNFLFTGNNDIFTKKLAKKCSKDDARVISYLVDELISGEYGKRNRKSILRDEQEIIYHIQFELLYSFDRELKKVNSIQSAGAFLDRLKEFNKLRMCIKEEDDFECYYCDRLDEICKMLKKQGIPENKINEFEEKYAYKSWLETVYENKELKIYMMENNFLDFLSDYPDINPRKVQLMYKIQSGVEFYGIKFLGKDKEKPYMIKTITYERSDEYVYDMPASTIILEDSNFETFKWNKQLQEEYEEIVANKKARKESEKDTNVVEKIKAYIFKQRYKKLLPKSSKENVVSNQSRRKKFMQDIAEGRLYKKENLSDLDNEKNSSLNEEKKDNEIEH